MNDTPKPATRLRDDFAQPLRSVAGLVLQRGEGGASLRVQAVLLDATTWAVLARASTEAAFHGNGTGDETSALVDALTRAVQVLGTLPDLVLLDETACLPPSHRRLARIFGSANDLPCIGLGREQPEGRHMALHAMRGAFAPLREDGQQVGWALRSQPDAEPLYLWPGHRVSMASSAELLMRFVRGDRLPEPLRE